MIYRYGKGGSRFIDEGAFIWIQNKNKYNSYYKRYFIDNDMINP